MYVICVHSCARVSWGCNNHIRRVARLHIFTMVTKVQLLSVLWILEESQNNHALI